MEGDAMSEAGRERLVPGRGASIAEPVTASAAPGKRTLVEAHGHGGMAVGSGGAAPGVIGTAQLAQGLQAERDSRPGSLAHGDVRFRVPLGADIGSILASGKVPESKLKDSIALVLTRMAKEGTLLVKDPVADIMKRIFPAAGTFSQTEFEKVVDVTNRDNIYKTVVDAETKVNSTDKVKLAAAMDDAIKRIDTVMADAAGLKQVFGSEDARAKTVYGKAKTKIGVVKGSMDTSVDTDYNRDDEQTGLGGWARFSTQHIHLQRKVAEVADKDKSMIVIIHECCHLADSAVDDAGYYGSPGFESKPDLDKTNNAAHYEELPRRLVGKSSYVGLTFTPGVMKGGGAVTFEDEVRTAATDHVRKAWDKAVDVHQFLRDIRKDIQSGNTASFIANKARILELSKLEHLTIHEQVPPTTINMNDIALSEGAAHATTLIKKEVPKQAVPAAPVAPKVKADYIKDVVDGAIKGYGALTGSSADDKALIDWLVKEYRKPL
jgi:hypothetical protein